MRVIYLLIVVVHLIACGHVSSNGKVEPSAVSQVQKDSCDNPDADINCSLIHMPASLNNVMSIASSNEFGERMIISGTVYKSDGKTPYPNVILYAYQTDHKGYTPKAERSREHKNGMEDYMVGAKRIKMADTKFNA